jgi:cytochrome c oxidase assembly protein subunit 15
VIRLLAGVWRPTEASVLRCAWASLVANVVIVLTGAAVRLTGSGLGCPTWPRCTEASGDDPGSFVPHGELGVHGAIEFANRMLTFALVVVAVLTFVAAWRLRPARRSFRRLSLLLALGIPAQAVIGGMTVLTDLNPWVVAGHLLVSMALISLAVAMVRRVPEGDGPRVATLPSAGVWLVRATYAATWVVLYLGTVVTGSGPHAGDADSPRNGLDPATMSQLHADVVFLLVGLTVGCVVVALATGAPGPVVRCAVVLLVAELAQGTIGFVQYATSLPEALVAAHVLGAAILVAAATDLVLRTSAPGKLPAPADSLSRAAS